MSKEIEGENGEKEIVYTSDEYTAATADLEKTKSELVELQRTNAERSENFVSYSKMTEEQKKVYDANTTNLLKREEALSTQVAELTGKLTEKENRDNQSTKDTVLTSIHHGSEESKKLLEEKYALLTGMPESTPQEVGARAIEAAKLAGIQIDQRNPLYIPVNGEAPNYKPNKEYTDTPAGVEAAEMVRAAIGLPTQKK